MRGIVSRVLASTGTDVKRVTRSTPSVLVQSAGPVPPEMTTMPKDVTGQFASLEFVKAVCKM